jgi:hypothetical protein
VRLPGRPDPTGHRVDGDGRTLVTVTHTEMLQRTRSSRPPIDTEMWLTIEDGRITYTDRYDPAEHSMGRAATSVSAPLAALDLLADYIERHLETTFTGDPEQRLVAGFRELAARGVLTGDAYGQSHLGGWTVAEKLFDLANVDMEFADTDGDGLVRRIRRTVPLRVTDLGHGTEKRLLAQFRPARDIEILEQYSGASSYRQILAVYAVYAPYAALETLTRSMERRLGRSPAADAEDGLVACVTALLDRGELPDDRPPGALRDQAVAWLRDAGVEYRLTTIPAMANLLSTGERQLELSFDVEQFSPMITFVEQGRTLIYDAVQTPYSSLDALLAHVDPDAALAGTGEERLLAHFRSLVARGELGTEIPPGDNRARVAALFAAAGVPSDAGFQESSHTLLVVRRPESKSWFALTLVFTFETVSLKESYEYMSEPGDPGREYIYSVRAPSASIGTLVAHLETRLGRAGDGDGRQRLIDCLAEAVRRGDLAAGLAPEENCRRVAAWCAEAGVGTEADFFVS